MTLRRTRCPLCKGKLEQGQRIHPGCIEEWAQKQEAKAARKAQREARARIKVARAMDRQRRRALETIPKLIKAADRAFMEWVRWRDRLAGLPCISSGKPLDWTGNQVDAGHWRSRGAASHLRYHPDNCHAQTKHENRHKAGNVVEYRIRLVERIGLERVLALECNNEPHHWTKEELREIAATYRSRTRELKREYEMQG